MLMIQEGWYILRSMLKLFMMQKTSLEASDTAIPCVQRKQSLENNAGFMKSYPLLLNMS